MFNLFKTYNKAKEVFVRPKIKWSFGLWKNSIGLPVWRRGNRIVLAKTQHYYYPSNVAIIKLYDAGDIKKDGTIAKHGTYIRSYHKLPKGSNLGVWNRNIRTKLRKYGFGWLKPIYVLPLWLSFYIFDFDVIYKWKYDDICFEFPPQFTIVFFGFEISLFLFPKKEDKYDNQYHYWESLLSFLYQKECDRNISKTLKFCGCWETFEGNETKEYFQLRKTHIKKQYHEEYDKAVEEYNKNK